METTVAVGIEEWSELVSKSFVALSARDVSAGFRGALDHTALGEFGITRVTSSSAVVERGTRLIGRDERDDVFLAIHLTGQGTLDQAGRRTTFTPHSASLFDAARPYRITLGGQASQLVLRMPRRSLGFREYVLGSVIARRIDSTSLNLSMLHHYLGGMLVKAGDGADDTLTHVTAELLRAVVSPLARGGSQIPMSDEVRLAALRDCVRREHSNPDLDVAQLARRHGISRRTVEHLFATRGESPASFIRSTRLASAVTQMRTHPSALISDIAYAAGFRDVTTFTRAFRRAFGDSPSNYRDRGYA